MRVARANIATDADADEESEPSREKSGRASWCESPVTHEYYAVKVEQQLSGNMLLIHSRITHSLDEEESPPTWHRGGEHRGRGWGFFPLVGIGGILVWSILIIIANPGDTYV